MKIMMVSSLGIPIGPGILKNESLGGSETAFICMSKALASLGHQVVCYTLIRNPGIAYEEAGVSYRPFIDYFRDEEQYDVAVASRDIGFLNEKPFNASHRVLWLHDMPSPDNYLQAQASAFWGIDEVFFLSEYHKAMWTKAHDLLSDHSWQTSNGLDLKLIDKVNQSVSPAKKKTFMFISRPERGLITLLGTIWPRICTEIDPTMHLKICSYAVPQRHLSPQVHDIYKQIDMLLSQTKNVTMLGNLPKEQLYKEIRQSTALLYPTDFPEISCIAVAEAAACGTPIVTTGRFALPETLGKNYPGLVDANPMTDLHHYSDLFLNKVRSLLGNPEPFIKAGYDAVDRRDWTDVARTWTIRFEDKVQDNNGTIPTPTVAGCMIVKNEEDHISGCLNSFAKHMDEVHITDTGSTDKTVARIEDWGRDHPECKLFIHHRDGLGDFDDARNQSISHTNCDWIFWIDADERLTNGETLSKYRRATMFNGCIIEQCHFYLDMEPASDTPVRLFRNTPLSLPFVKEPFKRIAFVGAIHEHPMQEDQNHPVHPVLQISNVRLAHHGYYTEEMRRSKVRDRNLHLLMRDRKKWPERVSGYVLTMRDLNHMYNWAKEKGQINGTYLQKVIGIFNDKFKPHSKDIPWWMVQMYEHGFQQYQTALVAAATDHISINGKLPFSSKVHISIAYASEAPMPRQGTLMWFLDETEFKNYMEGLADRSFGKMYGGFTEYDV